MKQQSANTVEKATTSQVHYKVKLTFLTVHLEFVSFQVSSAVTCTFYLAICKKLPNRIQDNNKIIAITPSMQ